MKKVIITLVASAMIAVACEKDKVSPGPTEDCTDTPTYTNDVKAILDTHCATSGCHNASSRANGLDYSTYSSASSKAGNSDFLGSIRHDGGFKAMPLGASKLSDANIMTLTCWVENGLPE